VRWFALLGALLFVHAAPAASQSRFSLGAGALLPLGTFDDNGADVSARVGGRVEFQSVNAIGQKGRVSWFVQAHYTELTLDDAYKNLLENAGYTTDATMYDAGAGIRVYSRIEILFLTAGGGWVRTDIAGRADDGVDAFAGAGVAVPLYVFMVEGEVTAHNGFFDGDDIQYLGATASLAMPF
jgi:hypothetical protein